MLIGIGTDIVEISRFMNIKQNVIEKIFTPTEIVYISRKKVETLAGIFAAKESVAKCFGCGFGKFSIRDIEILHNKKNAPLVKLHNAALKFSQQLKVINIKVSISHCKDFAVAFAIAET